MMMRNTNTYFSSFYDANAMDLVSKHLKCSTDRLFYHQSACQSGWVNEYPPESNQEIYILLGSRVLKCRCFIFKKKKKKCQFKLLNNFKWNGKRDKKKFNFLTKQ
eukprot:559463_1